MHCFRKYRALGTAASFGFGDRIGLATQGHVKAMQLAGQGILPVFAQQSIREMERTSRSSGQVLSDALEGMKQAGWDGSSGADADHLKTLSDVERTAAAGFTFFTIDPSEFVDQFAEHYEERTLPDKCFQLKGEADWIEEYLGKKVGLSTGKQIAFDEAACMRCAVKYGRAITHIKKLASRIQELQQSRGREYEIEISIDETENPTTLAEHFIIADQCLAFGIKLVSLAPRFAGTFEKGIDYIGNVDSLEESLNDHAAIAEKLGPYKLSLHSGSDKLSIYPTLARATKGMFHVKTAGTSYLEALRVVLRYDESLFRRIVDYSRECFNIDRKTYQVSATLESTQESSNLADAIALEKVYLERWSDVKPGSGFTAPGRQILHCTFGSVITHPQLAKEFVNLVHAHLDTYTELLVEHFTHHLRALSR